MEELNLYMSPSHEDDLFYSNLVPSLVVSENIATCFSEIVIFNYLTSWRSTERSKSLNFHAALADKNKG